MGFIEPIGYVAGACTTGSLIPQVQKLWTLRSAGEMSLTFFAVYGVGIGLWFVYGLRYESALAFQLAQIIAVPLLLTLVSLKVLYGGSSWRAGITVTALILALPAAAYVLHVATGIVGYVAGVLTTVALFPQVRKSARLARTDQLAWRFLGTFALGVSLWFVYGVLLPAWHIWATQIPTGTAVAYLVSLKLGYGDRLPFGSAIAGRGRLGPVRRFDGR